MKVTIVGLNYSPEPTGIAPYTAGLAEGLAQFGDDVRVVVGYPHYPQWRIESSFRGSTRRETSSGVRVLRLRHFVPRLPRLANRLLMELTFGLRAAIANWGSPEVIVLVSPALFSTLIAAVRARVSRVPTCIWVQDIYSLGVAESGTGGGFSARILSTIEGRVLSSAARVVVIHDRFKRYLVEDLGMDGNRVEVVRNWSHVETPGDFDREAERSRLGWKSAETIVLHAGNMGAKQALENVVEASFVSQSLGSDIKFVLMGDGNQRSSLEKMARGDRLEIIDPAREDQFMAVLLAADVLLVNERAGLTEMSVPSKLTSYFRTGLPVIAATDRGSVTAQEIELAGAGIRVDPGEPVALIRAAEVLAADSEASALFGAAGKSFSAAYHSEETAVRRFRTILEALVPDRDA